MLMVWQARCDWCVNFAAAALRLFNDLTDHELYLCLQKGFVW